MKDTGGPAFPIQEHAMGYGPHAFTEPTHCGMTLRDFMAVYALQSYMNWSLNEPIGELKSGDEAAAKYAKTAYQIADAMIEERKR